MGGNPTPPGFKTCATVLPLEEARQFYALCKREEVTVSETLRDYIRARLAAESDSARPPSGGDARS